MAELSHAAQAVAWAYKNTPEKESGNHRYHWLAAALRAAADQVVPYERTPEMMKLLELERLAQRKRTRTRLLAIAAELESAQ